MAKFKKGDRVRFLRDNPPYSVKGQCGTVDENNSITPFIWIDGKIDHRVAEFETELELISEEETVQPNYEIY